MFAFRRWVYLVLLVALAACAACKVEAAAGKPLLPPPRHGGVYVAAHRGAHEGIPENTLPAYQKAIELGCDFVEIDTRTTKDGKVVSIHNDDLADYTNGAVTAKVRELTLDEIRAVDIGSRIGPEFKDVKVPTFEEILDLCKGKIGIYLDLKDADMQLLVDAIKARGMERDIIWYLNAEETKQLQSICPDCIPMPDPGAIENLPKLLEEVKPKAVATMRQYYSAEFGELCHNAGAIVIMDDAGPNSWAPALEWKVDGIQTDTPAQLISYLEERAAKAGK
jgi:glycerophosphoryl diester phosphodiesterase